MYLLDWYRELARTRSAGMSGANPISYAEVDAWRRLMGHTVYPHEVDALMRIDFTARHPPDADDDG